MLLKCFITAFKLVCVAFVAIFMYKAVVGMVDEIYHQGYINGHMDTGKEYLFKTDRDDYE